jgi:hypothetical protein
VCKTPKTRTSAASFTLHIGDFARADVAVVKTHCVFAVISPLSFTILDKPRPDQIAVLQDENEIPTLIHLADTEADAATWLKAHPHDNVRFMRVGALEPRTFTYLQDPGHGWLIVSRDDLIDAGMSPGDFSSCSYVKEDSLALEEDCDMPALPQATRRARHSLRAARAEHQGRCLRPQLGLQSRFGGSSGLRRACSTPGSEGPSVE